MSAPSYSAAQLADRFGLAVAGDPATLVRGVATLAGATPDTLGFLANPRYRAQLSASRAGIVVMRAEDAEGYAGTALLARDPYSTFARIAALFEPVAAFEAGVHPSAVIDPTATIDPGAHIGPHVVVGARSTVDAGASLGPGCIVGEDCHVGAGSQLVARVRAKRIVHARIHRFGPEVAAAAAVDELSRDAGSRSRAAHAAAEAIIACISEFCAVGALRAVQR